MSDQVSIVTRTHGNRSGYLHRAAMSVFAQKFVSIEWIVVEDGSSTASTVLSALDAPSHISIKQISVPKAGRSHAGNVGLDLASGNYIGFLDDDDELFANHSDVLLQLLNQQVGAAGAYAAAVEVKRYRDSFPRNSEDVIFLHPIVSSTELASHNIFPIQSVLFRKEKLGGVRLDEELDALEDWLFWAELLIGRSIVWTSAVTSRFYIFGDPIDEQKRLRPHHENFSRVSEKIAKLLIKRGITELDLALEHNQQLLDRHIALAKSEGFTS